MYINPITVKQKNFGSAMSKDLGDQNTAFSERVRSVIGKNSMRSFAKKAGVHPASISQYLTGKTEPTRPTLIAIAEAVGVSVEWLATGRGPKHPDTPNEWPPDGYTIIREYEVEVSAGTGIDAQRGQAGFSIVQKRWIDKIGAKAEDLVLVNVTGDSMTPTVDHGDSVIVDTSSKGTARGGVFVVRIRDELLVKLVERDPIKNRMILKSSNKNYRDIEIDLNDENLDFEVVGRVVRAVKDF